MSLAVEFLKHLADTLLALHKAKSITSFNRGVCSQINPDRIFSDLSVRAVVPKRLETWLIQ